MRLGATEILVILGIVLLLFGGKRIPELFKALGKGIRNFREGVSGTAAPEDTEAPPAAGAPAAPLPAQNQKRNTPDNSGDSAQPPSAG